MKKIEIPPKRTQNNDDSLWDFFRELLIPYYKEINNELSKTDPLQALVLKLFNDPDYLYWSKVKYKVSPEVLKEKTKEDVWFGLKMLRKSKATKLQFGKYSFYYVPASLEKSLYFFDREFEQSLGNEIGFESNKKMYLQESISEESITSSQIEGAVTTRQKAKEMLEKQQTPRNKSEQMIANNYATIRHIYEHKNELLTPESLLFVHQLITNKTLDKKEEEGSFRTSDDIVIIDNIDGEVAHTPPSFTEISNFVKELCTFFNNDDEVFIHPIVKASIIHFMIGYFHPFNDGNGRTARALFYWYLLKNGYSLIEYLSISKVILATRNQYYKAFLYVENDDNDLTYFIDYQLTTLKKAFNELIIYIRNKNKEQLTFVNFQNEKNITLRQAEILHWFQANPALMLSIKEIENRLQISNQTARTDILGLVKLTYLKEILINKKEKRYIKP